MNKRDAEENQLTEKRLSSGYPLKGLLRLDTGEAFSPSGTKGIRYYVRQRAIKQGYKNCELKSLNANLLEDIVLAYTLNALPSEISQHILKHYENAKQDGWLILRRLIQLITISTYVIWLKLDKLAIDKLKTELDVQAFQVSVSKDSKLEKLTYPFEIVYPAEHQEDNSTITCKISIQIKRHDGRRYILSPDGNSIVLPNIDNPSNQSTTYQSTVILEAVSEVHAWKDQLMREGVTAKQLVKQIGKSDTYLYGRLKLLYLSPTLLKRITTHSLSPVVSLKDLLKAANYLDWKQQHHYLSIP